MIDILLESQETLANSLEQAKINSTFYFVTPSFEEIKNLSFFEDLSEWFLINKFKGEAGQSCLYIKKSSSHVSRYFFIGLGLLGSNTKEDYADTFRNGLGDVIELTKKYELTECAVILPQAPILDVSYQDFVVDSYTCLGLADYEFKKFKTNSKPAASCKIKLVCHTDKIDKNFVKTYSEAVISSANFVRDVADTPPNIAHPEFVAERAREVAAECNLKINIFGEAKAKELSMGGLLAVGSGSEHELKFVELEYSCKSPTAEKIVLIGKGVTFDSGGISLKPSHAMSGMKYDMCGAISVLGIIRAIAKLGANINVVALMPLVENMPGGSSYRQDDIITQFDGTTTEIENTDAEGRLILADAIGYAEKYHNPKLIIDIATLTGACVVALGHFFTGMFSNDQETANKLISIGQNVGDYVWQLPCNKKYAEGIKSKVADIANCGKSNFGGGAITAAMFLKHFVKKSKWVHLDIAGTEAELPIKSYLGKTATGVTLRLLIKFIKESF